MNPLSWLLRLAATRGSCPRESRRVGGEMKITPQRAKDDLAAQDAEEAVH